MVEIGQASLDERGKTTGGKAGNQNGRELNIRNYYLHTKGWRVFRALNKDQRIYIANACRMAVNNPNIGYDQNQRDSLWNQVRSKGYNPSLVTNPCETDCSALVRVCCAYSGTVLQNFNTSSEPKVLLGSRQFIEVKDFNPKTGLGLMVGDILVTKTKGHTAIVVTAEEDQKSDYYPKYTGTSNSIIEALNAVGEKDTSFTNRSKIASFNSINNYTGTASQNTKMLNLLKKGELRMM